MAKWGLVVIDTLLFYAIDYYAFDGQEKKISSEKSFKTIWETAAKRQGLRVQAPTTKKLAGAIPAPVVSAEILKKTEAVRQKEFIKSIDKPSEVDPSFTMLAELSLRKAAREQLPSEQRFRPSIPSSLGPNRPKNRKPTGLCPSKRYSTPASERSKRTTTMKLIDSSAGNRMASHKTKKDEVKAKPQRRSILRIPKKEIKDKNLNLFDERPTITQPPRTRNANVTPKVSLMTARKHMKIMMKVRKHRNTI